MGHFGGEDVCPDKEETPSIRLRRMAAVVLGVRGSLRGTGPHRAAKVKGAATSSASKVISAPM